MLLAMANPGGIQTKDTTYTKIFVGGLPYHTTNETLEEFFKQFGDIEEAVVINDRQTGKSKGYGFVTMADRASADRACEEPNPVIDGRKANVNLAYLGAKPRMPQTLPQVAGYPASFLQSQYGLQQFAAYPGAAYMAAAGMVGVGIGGSLPGAGSHAPSHQSQSHSHSHSQQPGQGSPTTAALQLALEYPFGYQQAAAASQYALPGYEHAQPAYAPYGVATNYFAGTAYSYAALPPHVASHLSAQLQQQQQLTERSQLS